MMPRPSRKYFNGRRKKRREELYRLLGGKCVRCDGTERLQFDHINPKDKNFIIADKIDAPMSVLMEELGKCVLLCAPCHRKKTMENDEFGVRSDHGTIWRYKSYKCRCPECKGAMREYNRSRRLRLLEQLQDQLEDGDVTLEVAAHRLLQLLKEAQGI